MKKYIVYILTMSYLFALLDWKVIYLTRFTHREWMDWMHTHEVQYSMLVRPIEYVLCTPALAIKEHFYLAIVGTQATKEEQDSIIHFDYSGNPLLPDGPYFWLLINRQSGWKKVSMVSWYLSWLPKILLWFVFIHKIQKVIPTLKLKHRHLFEIPKFYNKHTHQEKRSLLKKLLDKYYPLKREKA